MPEPTATPRHERGRAAVPIVIVPASVVADPVLSLTAKGLVLEASASQARLDVATVARRAVESADDVLDAVGDLLRLGYATLEVDQLVLTPVAGWTP